MDDRLFIVSLIAILILFGLVVRYIQYQIISEATKSNKRRREVEELIHLNRVRRSNKLIAAIKNSRQFRTNKS